ncbi:sirohydrochlorin nickelochelatase [Methanobrevibacter sp. 87.7]|uniref:sirohydrochlorin nickelochelatase n=1 Tax=Methanobrevibacter sp. 87.7 TaxID=387957 RepID=UPI003518E16B
MNENKTGILLLSHGSRLEDGAIVINAYKDMYTKNHPDAIVEVGFMEIRKPSIPDAFETLKSRGDLDKIIVVPVFVADGVHTKKDIPKILGLESKVEEKNHEHHDEDHEHHHHHHNIETVDFDGEIVLTEPLGIDERIFGIIEDRINEAL